MKGEILIESKSLRETLINRVDVLERVKRLELLPDDFHATIEMSANYFEVDPQIIHKTISRNRNELESDGMKILTKKRLSDFKSETGFTSKAPSLTLIPKRAILRMGMLLRDSEVAKEIRTQLLDSAEKKQEIAPILVPTSVEDLIILQAQSVKELKTEVAELKLLRQADSKQIDGVRETIESMADNLTAVPDHTVVVSTVNELHRWTRINHDQLYNTGYELLKKQHGIDIKQRVENERNKIQEEYHNKTGKWYSESTLKSKSNGVIMMTRLGCLDKYHSILVGMLTKEKSKNNNLRLVQ